MENSLIGIQITKFRKAAGITQEELGRAVGVSTQAVSRWECGGTPDISLLPAIADRLGVDINALFGREGGEMTDIFASVRRWVHALPGEQIVEQLQQLLWAGISQVPFHPNQVNELPYLKSCYDVSPGEGRAEDILCSNVEMNSGIYFGVAAEDLAFSILCPKPAQGYEAFFPDPDKARAFFALLTQPDCLELLVFMMHQQDRFYTLEYLAKGISREPEALSGILEKLCCTGLVGYTEVGMLDGPRVVYSIGNVSAVVPILYLTRILTQNRQMHYLNFSGRSKPLL